MQYSIPLLRPSALAALVLSASLILAGSVHAQSAGSKTNLTEGEARYSTPNRTLPKVSPPKTGLEFSAHPTTQEISQARVFEELLVPIGGNPSAEENAVLAAALLGYAKRSRPDDFSSLATFLEKHPNSSWRAALLTSLGIEYYNTAYYSRALEAWQEAWSLSERATELGGKIVADRAVCELVALYSRLGRMNELDSLLKSVEKRVFIGGATERINISREALAMMRTRPEVSFRCGPLALQSIKRSLDAQAPVFNEIATSVSTPQGFSLPEVAELSKQIGLNYQMGFRGDSGDFIVPSVVHWKAGHYAAIVRREGDRYLIEDPTFVNTVWATRQALEAETSGYFLIPPGDLPRGWRSVDAKEGGTVRGRGTPALSDPNIYGWNDLQTGSCSLDSSGMAVSSVHLMLANLQIRDTPVGYLPPVGPPVRFTVRYNQRDYLQPPSAVRTLLGPKWTHDWNEALKPEGADIKYIVGGGGARIFTGFNPTTQTYAPNLYDQTLLKRTGANTFEMTWPDGSRKMFGPLNGSLGFLLSQVTDPAGNAVTLTYDGNLRLVALTDAIGQVTSISYEHPMNLFLITKVTDPFGRAATFTYSVRGIPTGRSICEIPQPPQPEYDDMDFLVEITDVLGLKSRFDYTRVGLARTNHSCVLTNTTILLVSDQIESMSTPYGTTFFTTGSGTNTNNNTIFRFMETRHPDGSSDRVEYNQSDTLGIPSSDPPSSVPAGVATDNRFLHGRNTYYWSRTADASSRGDHTKAKIFHWLHTADVTSTAGILSSVKEPLEGRVWFDYPGGGSFSVGSSDQPAHIGRVLDDGQTQLYTMAYNSFGHLTNSVDPLGRTFSMTYATNGIDLLEVRQTRAANNELLFRATYNAQHRPITVVDAAGQTNTFAYNARGQVVTNTNAKGETTTYAYDTDGYVVAVDGPLPGTNDMVRFRYDSFGRTRTVTDESGYALNFTFDEMDRLTAVIYPDLTFDLFTYDRLDLVVFRDRADRQTSFEYDAVGQLKKQTDALGRVTRFDWCRCGQIKSLTDPLGHTTTWLSDVQGRPTAKQYADGSQITYQYENTSSRMRFVIDEKQQVMQFIWNRDDTFQSLAYGNAVIPTPGVSFQYDPDYKRVVAMTDGTGTTRYSYNPVTGTPALGAGVLASVDGPLPNDSITYSYDELGRPTHRAIHGMSVAMTYDAAWRLIGVTNVLGMFAHGFDGSSRRLVSRSLPNSQTEARSYGNNAQDRTLQGITHKLGTAPISEFLYGHDVKRGRITSWSQQAGAQPPNLFTFGYDSVNQLLSATVTNAGNLINTFAYTYDPAANRLTEQVGASNYVATYNGLNEITTTTVPGITRTNEWDALDRLVAVNVGNQRTEFTYDGLSRRVGIRQLVNGSEVSLRRFVWCAEEICEERDAAGAVTKRYFPQGVKIESGPAAGIYFYTRDHLGSIRELVDSSGNVRARYAYDPYGRRIKLAGDMEADFGFAGMFWSSEARLSLTLYRAYDPGLGRWLSRDPLSEAEIMEGPNLYAYVLNDPVNLIDPYGLMSTLTSCFTVNAVACTAAGIGVAKTVHTVGPPVANVIQTAGPRVAQCAQSAAPLIGRLQTLPGLGPDTVNMTAATASRIVPQVTQIAQNISRLPLPLLQRSQQAWEWYIRQKRLLPENMSLELLREESRRLAEEAQRLFNVRF